MAAGKQSATKQPAARELPPVVLGKFEHLFALTEEIVEANRGLFLDRMRVYTGEKRDATKRPLTAEEAVKAAAIYRDVVKEDVLDPVKLQAELYEWDKPTPRELLSAGGLAAGPVLVDALKQFTVVVEADTDEFLAALDDNKVDDLIAARVGELRAVSVADIRGRTTAALDHFAKEAGFGSAGEAVRPFIGAVTRALTEAATTVIQDLVDSSPDT